MDDQDYDDITAEVHSEAILFCASSIGFRVAQW